MEDKLEQWHYQGDINLEHGGYYFRFDYPHYCEVCRVVDLDSACGADGLTLIERLTVFGWEDKQRVEQALAFCCMEVSDLRGKGKFTILTIIVHALLSCGYYDPDDAWQGYQKPPWWVVVNSVYDPFSDMNGWDSWKPDIEETKVLHHKYNGDLKSYVEGHILG